MKLFAAVFAVLLCTASFAENLIQNGDFSQGLKFWGVSSKKIQISATVTTPDGKKAVCLPTHSTIKQYVKLEPDTDYELTYMIKGENIVPTKPSNSGGCIVFNAGKVWDRSTPAPRNARMTGTFDWKKHTYRFNSSKFKNQKLSIIPSINAKGRCYFADLKLVKVAK